MEKRNLTCIGCPMGCQITVEFDGDNISRVTGNSCAVGDKYARKEVTHPERTVTSTVVVTGGDRERLSVKTKGNIPKDLIFDYHLAAKQQKEMHRKYEVPVRAVRKDGAFLCPECNHRVGLKHTHCHWCGKKLGGW